MEIAYIVEVESVNAPDSLSSPLSGFFASDFSFSILPDVVSDNTPVSFL